MTFLAQNYFFAYVLVVLAVGLGLLTVCIPRPRKKFAVEKKKKVDNRHLRQKRN